MGLRFSRAKEFLKPLFKIWAANDANQYLKRWGLVTEGKKLQIIVKLMVKCGGFYEPRPINPKSWGSPLKSNHLKNNNFNPAGYEGQL